MDELKKLSPSINNFLLTASTDFEQKFSNSPFGPILQRTSCTRLCERLGGGERGRISKEGSQRGSKVKEKSHC